MVAKQLQIGNTNSTETVLGMPLVAPTSNRQYQTSNLKQHTPSKYEVLTPKVTESPAQPSVPQPTQQQ